LKAQGLPSVKGRHLDRIQPIDERGFELFEDVGLQARFKHAANRHYAELERELGNEEPGLTYSHDYTTTRFGDSVNAFVIHEDLPE
jgi:hypothetical protein